MYNQVAQVADFHNRHGFSMEESLPNHARSRPANSEFLKIQGQRLEKSAANIEKGTWLKKEGYDGRIMRAHLLMEELGELLQAMAKGDEAATLDGIADLVYVAIGTALTFDLPLAKAFEEIHSSNMSKSVGAGGSDDVRCRNKGENYRPPNIEAIINDHRKQVNDV